MYGGLFGDLPAAKKDKEEAAASNEPNAATSKTYNGEPASSASSIVSAPPPAKAAAAVPSLFPRFVPPQAARKRQQQQQQQQPTSRKRPLESSTTLSQKDQAEAEGTGVQDNSKEPKDTTELSSHNAVVTVISRQRRESNEVPEKTVGNALSSQFSDSVVDDIASSVYNNISEPPAGPQEPEQLRLLHERAREQDPYDPLLPNDLLQYWEHRSLAVEREKLFRQQQASMREQEELRLQLARERQQLEKAGDHDKLVEHRLQQQPSMMGRGRGVSNLPAWLEKQKKEAQQQQHG